MRLERIGRDRIMFKESKTLELKSIFVDDIKKEIIAFANSDGGKLLIGIQDNGEVIGVDNPDETALKIRNMVRDAIKPDLTMFVHYDTIQIDEKEVVSVEVLRGTERPYYIGKKGLRPEGVYVRQGYSSVPASVTMIRRMIKETDGDRFENMRSLEQNLTFESALQEFTDRNLSFENAQKKTLGVINPDDLYTNLGFLLSDQCNYSIKIAAFEGITQEQFKDRKEVSGSLFKQLNEAYEYIEFHNQTHSSFDKLRRIDQKDYPIVAVREALMNSIVHREYAFHASNLISFYDDRIEFTSIGGLLSGLTLNDIMMGVSFARNEKLANIFYRLEFIEAYGTGIRKIMDAYKDFNRKPVFEISDNVFRIVLPNCNYEAEMSARNKDMIINDTHGAGELSDKEKVIRLARAQEAITRKDIESLLGVSTSTCTRLLRELVKEDVLVPIGNGKNTRYQIK